MSAETLRRAAELMRERAEAATPGGPRWETLPDEVMPSRSLILPADSDSAIAYAEGDDAEHIASWHPTVALAVADWLDAQARLYFNGTGLTDHKALAVARAYLGEA